MDLLIHRAAGYHESRQLTHLVEQLRERLGSEPPPPPRLVPHLESVLSRLLVRNQRLRVLQRLTRTNGSPEHIEAMRGAIEQLDALLLHELPHLLERLQVQH